ncbi:hypothetical protein JQS43_22620 [Natronosporangium hydrolyticum]|uniref:DUF3887 domain-containing protein n=1 Tax=Natronosporangium hydrolyticum TaxID=2811111 RepID=A0A895YDM4_9ACTN|nr:hypothetical protein [Natronosporangium hydrolyticum]QSB14272.1 hypothetical protein JQS43_22620 [Natronosporangium hydrolyticum]
MKPRRLATLAVVGALLAGALTACRADPSVAAYVDGAQITEAEVDEAVGEIADLLSADLDQGLAQFQEMLDQQVAQDDEFDTADAESQYQEYASEQQGQLAEQMQALRTWVVEMRVLTEAANQYADELEITIPAGDPAGMAQELGLPADFAFVAVVADYDAVRSQLQGTLEPAEPTEADKREVYDNLVAEGHTQEPYESVQQVLTAEVLAEPVAMRNLFEEIVNGVEITLNPRYDLQFRIEVQLFGVESWLTVSLGDPAVAEVS